MVLDYLMTSLNALLQSISFASLVVEEKDPVFFFTDQSQGMKLCSQLSKEYRW